VHKSACRGAVEEQIDRLTESKRLLQGRLSKDVMERFCLQNRGLFPRRTSQYLPTLQTWSARLRTAHPARITEVGIRR
jgi:hypothetical protein